MNINIISSCVELCSDNLWEIIYNLEKSDNDICLYHYRNFEKLCENHIDEPWNYNLHNLEDYMDNNKDNVILIENTGIKAYGQIVTEKVFFMKNETIRNEIIRELKHIAKICEQNNVIGH